MKDPNIAYISSNCFSKASPDSINWSDEKSKNVLGSIGLGSVVPKTKRVVVVVMNKAVAEKFSEKLLNGSEYEIVVACNADECEEYLQEDHKHKPEPTETEGAILLPITAILVHPTASDGQKAALTELASKYSSNSSGGSEIGGDSHCVITLVVSVPRNCLTILREQSN